MVKNKNRSLLLYISFVIYVFFLMLFCTKSSPLYIMNDWYDANAYFTMGKGIINGAVPYRDLFDHKGPFLYLLYGLGYLMDHTGFSGIFIIQIISMSLSVIFSYKICRLFTHSDFASAVIALLMPVMMLSDRIYVLNSDLGGGSPDEFITPLFVISIYLVVPVFKDKKHIDSGCLSMFLVGILSGLILLLKFNFFAFTVGLLAPVLMVLAFKQFKTFYKFALCLAGGCIVSFIPYIIYALATNSLHDFINVYLKFNMAYASTGNANLLYSLLSGLKNSVSILLNDYRLYFLISVFGILYFIYSYRRNLALNLSIFFSFALTVISISIKYLPYSYVPVAVFTIFGYLALYDLFTHLKENLVQKQKKMNIVITAFTVMLIFAFTVGNNGLITQKLNRATYINPNPCQQIVADIILSDKKENQTLLEVLSLDSGFYTYSGIVPSSRYFYLPNVSFEQYSDVYISQYEDIEAGINTFLITTFESVRIEGMEHEAVLKDNYFVKIQDAIARNYELVQIVSGTYLQEGRTYYLFKKV